MGFREVDYVYEPGQFARRGSILDVFSYSNELPYRLDFFDDEIDSIRTFNVETQLSEQRLQEMSVVPPSAAEGDSVAGVSLLEFAGEGTLLRGVRRDSCQSRARYRVAVFLRVGCACR